MTSSSLRPKSSAGGVGFEREAFLDLHLSRAVCSAFFALAQMTDGRRRGTLLVVTASDGRRRRALQVNYKNAWKTKKRQQLDFNDQRVVGVGVEARWGEGQGSVKGWEGSSSHAGCGVRRRRFVGAIKYLPRCLQTD